MISPQGHGTGGTRDEQLAAVIKSVGEGDQYALAALYDATSRLVYGLSLRILGDAGAAEEVLGDVYLQVWRQAGRFDQRRGGPLAWISTIARTRAIDRLRSSRHEKFEEPLETARVAGLSADAVGALTNSEHRQMVGAALSALPAEQREVIRLAFYEGLSHSEIAARLAQPLGTVKTRARQGLIKLREMLKTEYKDG